MKSDQELLDDFKKRRNLKSSSMRQYQTALKKYTEYNNMSLIELLNEAKIEEDYDVPKQKRKLQVRLLEFRNFISVMYKKNYTKSIMVKILALYSTYDLEIPKLPILSEDVILDDFADKIFEMNLEDIENFNFPYDELFGLKIVHNFEYYCFLIRFSSKSDKLICFGSGAEERNEKNFNSPVFHRQSWHSEFDASVIYYSDPIFLHSKTAICGWCVGTPQEYYLIYIKEMLEKLCINKNIKNHNMLFFGSSAGGFTSMQLGAFFKKSKVLVDNPQVDIRNFNERPYYYETFLKTCFQDMDKELVEKKFSDRFNVFSTFKKENYLPKIYYILELFSDVDFEDNLIPFLRGIKKLNLVNSKNSVQIMIYNEHGSHTPLNKVETIKLINNLSNDLVITLNNMQDIKISNRVKFSIPHNFVDVNHIADNKLKLINKKNESIYIDKYASNKDLSENSYKTKIISLNEDINSEILIQEVFNVYNTQVYMINVKTDTRIRTLFFFERYGDSYLMVFYDFNDTNYEMDVARKIILDMKKEAFIN